MRIHLPLIGVMSKTIEFHPLPIATSDHERIGSTQLMGASCQYTHRQLTRHPCANDRQ
jgi:hypothetical protein